MGRVGSLAALVALAVLGLAACAREPLREQARLAALAGGTPHLHTLADETRPILGDPPARPLLLTVPPGQGPSFTFALPPGVAGDVVIATGALMRWKRAYDLPPARLAVTPDGAGGRRAALPLPFVARGPGPPSQLTLALTTPPAAPVVERRAGPVAVPAGATLDFAYGLTAAATVPDAGPVALEIAAEVEGGPARVLWSTTLTPGDAAAHRWQEATVALDALGGARATFVFRARAAGNAPAVLVPVWGDPTVVAPGPRPPGHRNVIVISLDTLRADRVGVYGAYRPTTPGLDALAGDTAVLTNAWAPWPETSGAHMSLFTSRYPSEHGVTGFIHAPPAAIELLAERLRREGYLTRAFTEDGGVWAFAGFARGFSAYGERRSPDFVYRGEAGETFADAARWLEGHADRVFFLFVHTYEVHAPYAPPAEYGAYFADVPGREPPAMRADALAYDRETRHLDDALAALLATVRRLDLAERSIVVITSDHGEEFGEHGGLGHGRTLHREVLHVPLIVWAPGLVPASRLDLPASLLDVAPTVLDLLGLAPDPGHRGRSLAAPLTAAAPPDGAAPRALFAEVDRVDRGIPRRAVAVRQGGETAILDLTDGSVRCYADDDPAEERPRPACPDLETAIAAHRAAMRPAESGKPATLDPRLIEKMRALGYLD